MDLDLDETMKLVKTLKNVSLQLGEINYNQVQLELGDLDTLEKKDLLIEVGKSIFEVFVSLRRVS
jgi:hypothetical protein